MAVESVKQMSIFELADLIGIDWTRLRQAAIEQAADDQSSVSRMPTELKETVENYQRDGFLLPDDFGIKLDALKRWPKSDDRQDGDSGRPRS
jgi:cell division protein YceG involved in septum cleavage